jgi:two-component system OmpR family response regulator
MVRPADSLKVYVVEDSPIILRLLLSGIASGGGELVGSADNAAQAIREIQSLKPHLVTVDLVLASGSGFEVLAALQTGDGGRNAVAVVLTNHVTDEDRARSLRLGASHFFDKSTQCWQALELINKMAAERRGRTLTRSDPEQPNGQG